MTMGDNHADEILRFPSTGKARLRATGQCVSIEDVLSSK
jgi:hypothetical protein